MNDEKGSIPNYGSPNMMDTIKTNIMTMMMINGSKSGTGDAPVFWHRDLRKYITKKIKSMKEFASFQSQS